MGPDDWLLLVMLTALTLYALLGGADFGAGVWEFTTALQSSEHERQHIYKAIGPVWEANHVWLIFILMILMNGFPLAFAALSRALWLPLLLSLVGIVFRGASYVFRSYSQGPQGERTLWEAVFAIASTATPFFLGASAGAIASGKLAISPSGEYQASVLTGWMTALPIFTAFFSVALCGFSSAVFLTREAALLGDEVLTRLWKQRAMATGLWMGLLSSGGLAMVAVEAPKLAAGFAERGWPLVLGAVASGSATLVALARERFGVAVLLAMTAVAAVLWGWGVSQYPVIVPPHLTAAATRAPDVVLWPMLIVIALGAVLLLPALGYLMYLFKSGPAVND